MKKLTCTACGLTTSKDLPRCPACGRKSLVFNHTFESNILPYHRMINGSEGAGSHPVVHMLTVTALITVLSGVLFRFMFP